MIMLLIRSQSHHGRFRPLARKEVKNSKIMLTLISIIHPNTKQRQFNEKHIIDTLAQVFRNHRQTDLNQTHGTRHIHDL